MTAKAKIYKYLLILTELIINYGILIFGFLNNNINLFAVIFIYWWISQINSIFSLIIFHVTPINGLDQKHKNTLSQGLGLIPFSVFHLVLIFVFGPYLSNLYTQENYSYMNFLAQSFNLYFIIYFVTTTIVTILTNFIYLKREKQNYMVSSGMCAMYGKQTILQFTLIFGVGMSAVFDRNVFWVVFLILSALLDFQLKYLEYFRPNTLRVEKKALP